MGEHGVPKWVSSEKLAGWVRTGEGELRVPIWVSTEYQRREHRVPEGEHSVPKWEGTEHQKREIDILNLMTTARSTVVRTEYQGEHGVPN